MKDILYYSDYEDDFAPVTGVITPSGGSIHSYYSQLMIPPQAVDKDTVITMTTLKDSPTDKMEIDVSVFMLYHSEIFRWQ